MFLVCIIVNINLVNIAMGFFYQETAESSSVCALFLFKIHLQCLCRSNLTRSIYKHENY